MLTLKTSRCLPLDSVEALNIVGVLQSMFLDAEGAAQSMITIRTDKPPLGSGAGRPAWPHPFSLIITPLTEDGEKTMPWELLPLLSSSYLDTYLPGEWHRNVDVQRQSMAYAERLCAPYKRSMRATPRDYQRLVARIDKSLALVLGFVTEVVFIDGLEFSSQGLVSAVATNMFSENPYVYPCHEGAEVIVSLAVRTTTCEDGDAGDDSVEGGDDDEDG